ncbi:MAG: molecular chaperone DnaJ [Proteobacteria bacterium]|nr:molecular chaperone DnaJ [Pseudomonadota bacterium]
MFPLFILGLALLAGLLLAGRWFTTADPKTLIKVLKGLLFGVIGVVALFFVFTGRLAWAFFALPALIPWFMRARRAHRMYKTFSRMASGGPGSAGKGGAGQSSDVETRFLRMALDHATGQMTGQVLEGDFAGRALDSMSVNELVDLLKTCWVEDTPSAQVLETYINRTHPDWRQATQDDGEGAGSGAGPMTRAMALEILGLGEGAGEQEIKDAHRRLIAGLHPDRGGSTYLAAQINRAKDVLVGD